MATGDSTPKKRIRRRWPPEALEIAHKKTHPAALCEELMALSGHDKLACWRFLKKHGVERPGASSRHVFDPQTAETITEYVSEHGVLAASQRFHCSAKSVYNLLHRRGYTRRAHDWFSLGEICNHLRVKYSKAL
jgi:hypothetical protein